MPAPTLRTLPARFFPRCRRRWQPDAAWHLDRVRGQAHLSTVWRPRMRAQPEQQLGQVGKGRASAKQRKEAPSDIGSPLQEEVGAQRLSPATVLSKGHGPEALQLLQTLAADLH